MLRERTCCFTGHRNISIETYCELFNITEKVVVRAIENGYKYFGTGGALGFDTISAQVVLKLKERYPDIRLILVLPCLKQSNSWSCDDIKIYDEIKTKADKVVYTSRDYYSGCMYKRNRHLVDNSSLCICYLTERKGGTFYTVNYAKKRRLNIFNIAKYL